MLVRPKIVVPDCVRVCILAGGLLVEKEDIRFHTLSVEDPGWEAKDRVEVEVIKKALADRLTRTTLEEHVVGNDDGSLAVDFEQRGDVL